MVPPRCLALAFVALLSGCGSIVESTPEKSPPASGSEMEGIAYWLPKGSVLIDGSWEQGKECTIKVGTLIEPDTSSRWRLTRNINHLFEDNVVLEVDPATGLLKTVGGTSEDRSAQIAATALEVAAKAMTFGAGGAVSQLEFRPTEKPKECPKLRTPFHIKISADQLNRKYDQCFTIIGPAAPPPKEKEKVSGQEEKPLAQDARSNPPVVTLNFDITRLDEPASAAEKPIGKIVHEKLIVDGIVVRAPAPYQVKITQKEPVETGPDLSGEQIVFLPDPIRIYYLPLDRTPFVRNETKIALVNGVVQSVTTSRPSIILGIVGVPKTILTALVPLK